MSETLQTRERKAQPPREDEWFEVNSQTIDRSLFESERSDEDEEEVRGWIQWAFEQVEKEPEKYAEPFETIISKNACMQYLSCTTMEHLTYKFDRTDIVEQLLEWAQRISNGETWEAVCNDKETAVREVLHLPYYIGQKRFLWLSCASTFINQEEMRDCRIRKGALQSITRKKLA